MATATTNPTTTSFSNSLSNSVTNRWAGMIEQSIYKKTRNSLFMFTSYVYNECPPMFLLHHIVSIFRLLQFIGPAFFVPYKNFWPDGSISETLMDFFSMFFHIFPSTIRDVCAIPYLIFYVVFFTIFFVFVCSSAFYYKKNAKLANWVPIAFYIFLNSFGYLLHPIAFELGGELFGKIINKKCENNFALSIVLIVLMVVVYAIYLWMQSTVTSTSILFNPTSLITILEQPQMFLAFFTNVITFLLAIASQCSKIPMHVLIAITACIYIVSIFIPFNYGGFIYILHSNIVVECGISGTIFCISATVMDSLGIYGNEVLVFVLVAILIVSYVIASFLTAYRRKRALRILDAIEDNKDDMDLIRSPSRFEEYVVVGLSVAHPLCISWDIFQYAVERWPTDVNIWVIYAKFVVIYPEETQKVGWIQHQMMSLHIKGATSKHIQEEIITMIKMRESNISPELKKKLNKINKKVQLVKHKLRHIWDLIIQGNIADMGTFIDKTYDSVQQCEAEYNHLIRTYPNSRFITRSYARFLLEVKADHEKFIEWAEKAQNIRRGVSVTVDHAHELGLTYFPFLPSNVNTMGDNSNSPTQLDSESQLIEADESDEKSQVAFEQSVAIRQQIDELTIPGTFNTILQRILISLVLFLLAAVIATIIIFQTEKKFSTPLIYLHHSAMLRSYVFLTTSYGIHYIQEKTGAVPPRQDFIDDSEEAPPVSLGNTWDLRMQFSYLLNQLSESVKDLGGMRSVAEDNENMNRAREHIFGPSLNYTYYSSESNLTTNQESVTVASMDIVTQLSNIVTSEVIEKEIYNSSMVVNPTLNADKVALSLSDALKYTTEYINDNYDRLTQILLILKIVFFIFYPVFLLVILFVEIRRITDNKTVIYKCLTLLPKNVVSSVADSLKIMRGEQSETSTRTEQDSEMNKQEENMLKIFATASDSSSSKFSNNILMLVCTVITITLSILIIVQINILFTDMSLSIYNAAPNINNLMGAYAYQCSMLMTISIIASENAGYKIITSNSTQLIDKLKLDLDESLNFFHKARFGSTDGTYTAFEELNEGVMIQDQKFSCNENESLSAPKSLRDSYKCISVEMLFYSIENFVSSLALPMIENNEMFTPSHDVMRNLWEISTVFMFDRFFYPISSGIIGAVEETIIETIEKSLSICYVIFVAEVIVELVVIYDCVIMQKKMKFSLKLLLHCQPSVVMQIPLITNVLSGNFKLPKGDNSSLNREIYDEILNQLPDPLIITDESGKIKSVNTHGKRMFSDIEGLIGMNIHDFMNLPMFEGTMKEIKKAAPQEEEVSYTNSTNNKFNLNIKSLAFNQTTAYIIRDITQTVRYNTLIDEEREKSDKLLESILPAKLVKRVQQGEKNISFSVQSASIVFMDIVSFTPWCGSLPANRVVEILNILYKEFDALVTKYPTITKIKCIGDCYMAAGGIFSEINQPAIHAKEMVEFGLDSLSAVESVNRKTGQTLKIRVGINTGGPLVAGVIGSGKPTFEIIGPAINMAQQMEHNGVPMQVHISRAVYELIYGGDFNIKERGQIELKNGPAVTYLVSP